MCRTRNLLDVEHMRGTYVYLALCPEVAQPLTSQRLAVSSTPPAVQRLTPLMPLTPYKSVLSYMCAPSA